MQVIIRDTWDLGNKGEDRRGQLFKQDASLKRKGQAMILAKQVQYYDKVTMRKRKQTLVSFTENDRIALATTD